MSYSPVMTQACVLWDCPTYYNNLTLVYTGTTVVGYEPINACDWRDFSLFQVNLAASSNNTLTCLATGTTSGAIDTVALWWQAFSADCTVGIYVETATNVFTLDQSVSLAADGGQMWVNLTTSYAIATSRRIRFQFNSTAGCSINFRQISAGRKDQFPIGQWSGVQAPIFTQGIVVENVIAVGGSVIGRNLRRLQKQGKISLTYLDPAWARTYWQPFANAATTQPFWWQWNPTAYPQEIGFAVAMEVNSPTNMMPPPLLSVDMPMQFLTP